MVVAGNCPGQWFTIKHNIKGVYTRQESLNDSSRRIINAVITRGGNKIIILACRHIYHFIVVVCIFKRGNVCDFIHLVYAHHFRYEVLCSRAHGIDIKGRRMIFSWWNIKHSNDVIGCGWNRSCRIIFNKYFVSSSVPIAKVRGEVIRQTGYIGNIICVFESGAIITKWRLQITFVDELNVRINPDIEFSRVNSKGSGNIVYVVLI